MKAPSLNELPYNLESRQLRIFENIRFLIQCLENSYSHLELELITLTDKKIELPRLCFIVNSAWSIIDIYQRLHTCIFKLKFIEGRSLGNILGREFKKTFNSQMSSVTALRNNYQHIYDGRFEASTELNNNILGLLQWFVKIDEKSCSWHTLLPGHINGTYNTPEKTLPNSIRHTVDHISISSVDYKKGSVSNSEIIVQITELYYCTTELRRLLNLYIEQSLPEIEFESQSYMLATLKINFK